jgi:hypothetical protein
VAVVEQLEDRLLLLRVELESRIGHPGQEAVQDLAAVRLVAGRQVARQWTVGTRLVGRHGASGVQWIRTRRTPHARAASTSSPM